MKIGFVSRRPGVKKRNKQLAPAGRQYLLRAYDYLPSDDPAWRNKAKRIITRQGCVDLYFWSSDLKILCRRREHIVIWEIANKEKVPIGWVIHHQNGDRTDNEPNNLLALTKGMHMALHRRLEWMATQFTGIQYVVQRHNLNAEYARRAKDLLERHRNWFED